MTQERKIPKAANGSDATEAELTRLGQLAQQQAKRVLDKLPLLGPVTWLMMQQSATRHTLLSELEWRVLPPLVLDQAKLYMQGASPVAFVSWARLSKAAVDRYRQAPHHLAPADWKSGDQLWIIDAVVPFGAAREVIADVKEKVLPGQTLHQLVPLPGEPVQIVTW